MDPDRIDQPAQSEALPRRSLLAAILGIGAALSAATIGLAGGFLSNSFGRKRERNWIRVGAAEDLDPETFRRHVVSVESKHAWVQQRSAMVLYIKDAYPEDPIVFHARCSHLGCAVNWESESSRFVCPCHGGAYAQDGTVLEGPPPRPLTSLEVKIEEEICFVRLPEGGDEA